MYIWFIHLKSMIFLFLKKQSCPLPWANIVKNYVLKRQRECRSLFSLLRNLLSNLLSHSKHTVFYLISSFTWFTFLQELQCIVFLFLNYDFYWRIIALQYCVGLCTWFILFCIYMSASTSKYSKFALQILFSLQISWEAEGYNLSPVDSYILSNLAPISFLIGVMYSYSPNAISAF